MAPPQRHEVDLLSGGQFAPAIVGDLGRLSTGRHGGYIDGMAQYYATAGAEGATSDSLAVIWRGSGASNPPTIQFSDDLVGYGLPNNQTKAVIAHIHVPLEIDLATVNPILRVAMAVYSPGAGNATADFTTKAFYISSGESVEKAFDESIASTPTIIDVDNELQFLSVTLDRTKILAGDLLKFVFERNGTTDAYSGNLAVLEFGSQFRYRRM
jgi:hypothetical protein